MTIVLTDDEGELLATVLRQLVVRDRTGEVGIAHGAERFVGTSMCLRKPERRALDRVAEKLGLADGVRVDER